MAAERERIERERRELEEQRARLAATTITPSPVDFGQTQPQRQGVTTGPVNSMPGVQSQPNMGYQSQPQFQTSSPGFAEPKKSGVPMALIAAIIGVVVLVGGGGGIYFLTRSKAPDTTKTDGTQTDGTKTDGTKSDGSGTIKPDLVAIPGGTFQMGRSDGLPAEIPPHTVTVNAFYMDRTEVTNEEYAQFVKETGHAAPSHFVNGKPVVGQEKWPVVNVSLKDAQDFADWRSKRDKVTYRLPTEEEWEYAARNGDQNNLYPWGSSWEANRAVTKEAGPASLKPVGSMPDGKNKWGVVDLIGNAWEWTSSKASYYQGSRLQLPAEHKDWNVIRGGSMLSESKGDKPISATYRDWIKPTETNQLLSFRLIRPGS
jgi:formylglycine-generating enzyme required for sulfatase activity